MILYIQYLYILQTVHCTYSILYILYTVHIVYTVYCTHCIYCRLNTLYISYIYIVNTINCTYSYIYILYIVDIIRTEHTVWIVQALYSIVRTVHYTIHIVYTVHTVPIEYIVHTVYTIHVYTVMLPTQDGDMKNIRELSTGNDWTEGDGDCRRNGFPARKKATDQSRLEHSPSRGHDQQDPCYAYELILVEMW